jgi:hypothetical protein
MRQPTEAERLAALEFRSSPFGRHSPELQRLLLEFRREPFPEKHVLVCVEPYRRWVVARLSGQRGAAPVPVEGLAFDRIADAEWAVFRLRWRRLFGEDLR